MKKFPIYTQHDAMDCGPTCLRMVAAYYGKKYSIENLREKSFISRNGVTMLGLSEAAEKLGFHSMGIQVSLHNLVNDVPLPCILHWNQNHFVVLYHISNHKGEKTFYVADPIGSLINYTEKEFSKCWISKTGNDADLGFALCLETTPTFYEQEDNCPKHKRSLLFLAAYLRPYKQLIGQLFVGLFVGSLLQLILPFLTQSIVDFGISNQNLNYVWLVLIAQLVLVISNTSVEFIRSWILLHIGMKVNISLISDYIAKLTNLPISYFDTKQTGDTLQRINDHDRIQEFLTDTSLNALFSIFNIVIFGIVIFIYSRIVFGIFFIGSALYVAWVWLFMKRRATLDHKMFAQHSANQSNIIQLITGMQEIKLNACEQQKRWQWERIQTSIYKITSKGLALAQWQQSGGILINQIKNIIIIALVASLVIQGDITLGMMVSIQYIIGQLNSPVEQLITFFRKYQDAKLSLDRISDIYDKQDEDDRNAQNVQDIKQQDIKIENVTFRYDKLNEKPTLDHVNITFEKGKTTAIVGVSGSGKTTILKMILGFYKPDEGKVIIGNCDLQNCNLRNWRKKCGVVMQDGFIFSDTIANNIAPKGEAIDEERLVEAAEIANISSYIDELPMGYNTKIGAEGNGLSMGQKQRILIARAVYKNPDFIFLDEATNSLDANNEKEIMNRMDSFLKGKTAIVIAHRLSTVRNADKIIVIQDGKVAEEGKHEQLIAQEGIYYRLVKNQLNV